MFVRLPAVVFPLVLAPALLHASSSQDAVALVKKTLDGAVAIARAGGDRNESLAALRTAVREILDTKAMGRRAIGDVLGAQPPEQQVEYLALFDEVIVHAYLSKLLLFRDPHFEYSLPVRRDGSLIVRTRIVTAKDEYRVDYEMQEHDERWLATDILVEDISMTQNYHAQFASLLRDHTFAELLDLMRSKTQAARKEAP